MFRPWSGTSGVCNVRVSLALDSRSHLRIPSSAPPRSTFLSRLSEPRYALTCENAVQRRRFRVTLDSHGRGTCHMTFKVGDTVVYPHHGAALIEAIETRQIKGVDKTYLVLKVAQGDLTVRVPADNAEFVGVRDVVSRGWAGPGLRGAARAVRRGAHELVSSLQGKSGEARLRRCHQGRGSRA